MLKVYIHETCSTCRNAIQWLDKAGIPYRPIPIRQHPPEAGELKRALDAAHGNLRKVFNTSGMDYRALGLKDQLPTMSETEAIQHLSGNGMLVKRPFVVGRDTILTGFKPEQWQQALVHAD